MTIRIHGDKIEFPDGTEQFTASTGSGGGSKLIATPPVHFMGIVTDVITSETAGVSEDVVFRNKVNDSDNGFNADGSIYTIQKDGVYKLNTTLTTTMTSGSHRFSRAKIQVKFAGTDTFATLSTGLSLMEKTAQSSNHYSQVVVNCIQKFNTGDELKVIWAVSDSTKVTLYNGENACTFSGHMVSSMTEGEVKEKEAVVFKAMPDGNGTLTPASWQPIDFDSVIDNTNGEYSDKKYTPKVAGYYHFNFGLKQGTNTKRLAIMLQKNGVESGQHFQNSINNSQLGQSITTSGILHMNGTTDYVKFLGYIEEGGTFYGGPNPWNTWCDAHLITGQSSGGGTGEATGTPSSFARIVDEKPQGTYGGASIAGIQDRTLNKIEYDTDNIVTLSNAKEFTLQKGTYVIDFSAPSFTTHYHNAWLYSVTDNVKVAQGSNAFSGKEGNYASSSSSGSYSVTLTAPHTYKIQHYTNTAKANSGLGIVGESGVSIYTTVDIQKVGTGGASSGGGSYTPEKMVWSEDLGGTFGTGKRELNKEYENTNDVPLYVQLYLNIKESARSYCSFSIDDNIMGYIGQGNRGTPSGSNPLQTAMFIVPAGSKYKLSNADSATDPNEYYWREARMPVAVGTGGKTVAFRAHLSATQTVETGWSKVNLDTATIDTDSAFADGKFKPSVAGYYQINGSVNQSCSPSSTNTTCSIRKNNSNVAMGTEVTSSLAQRSVVSDIVYLDPKNKWTDTDGNDHVGDYIELYAAVTSAGTCAFTGNKSITFLSAVLVSGGSASDAPKYAEGKWTPTIGGATTDPTCTYIENAGYYVKNGSSVYVTGTIRCSAISGGSGQVDINGLPFNVKDLFSETAVEASGSVGYFSGLVKPKSSLGVWAFNDTTTLKVTSYETTHAAAPYLEISEIGNAFQVRFTITYITDE